MGIIIDIILIAIIILSAFLGYKKGLCPNVEEVYKQIITLPLHPKMTNEDVEYTIKSLKDIIRELKENGK